MNYNSFLRSIPRTFSLRFLLSMFKNYNKNKVKFLIIRFKGFHKVQLAILMITCSVAGIKSSLNRRNSYLLCINVAILRILAVC
jgi:hypothetical protein